MNIKEKVMSHFQAVAKTKKSPQSIGIGFAIGTYLSLLPTPGFSIFLGVMIVLIFTKVNKYALFIAMAIWNPLVTAPFYVLSYQLGDLIFGGEPVVRFEIVLFNQIYNFTKRFLLGNAIISLTISALSYAAVTFTVKKIRKE